MCGGCTDLRKSSIVPDIAVVWEAVIHKARFFLLDVLFDWVQGFFLADLQVGILSSVHCTITSP